MVVIQECLSRNGDYCPFCAYLYMPAYVLGMKLDNAKQWQTFSFSTIFKAQSGLRRGEKQNDKERKGAGRSGCGLVDL